MNKTVSKKGATKAKGQTANSNPYCFVSYSSWEPQAQLVLACLHFLFKDRFEIHYTPSALESGGSQLSQITKLIRQCSFGVVILDGFRPNVIFEYGMLRGRDKPVILIMGDKATVDMKLYLESTPATPVANVPITIDKQFSDVKDEFRTGCDLSNFAAVLKILKEESEKKHLL